MKEKDKFILDIKRLGINGEGIGYYNKLAIFVNDAIPGEGVNVEVTKVDKKMAFAKILEYKKKSPNRIEAQCPYYKDCGGCNVLHIKYEEMLKLKKDFVIESLQRYTNINPKSFEIRETIASPKIFNYRNKSQVPVRKNLDGNYETCMIKAKSNELINVKDCLVNDEIINDLNKKILTLADELGIPPYLAKYNRGVLRYLSIRVNKKGEAMVCFICYEKNEKIKELAKRVIALENVKSVYENFNNSSKATEIYGPITNHLEGDIFLIEPIGNVKYQLTPTTFFQLNTLQAENMFNLVLKACKLSKKERVLDAYCGVGAIGLYLAKMAKEVVGIENNPSSVEAAKANAKLNKINNAKFILGDATELLPKMLENNDSFDVIVADPPRTGLGENFVDAILNSGIKRFIYVSCNPSTLAKDLELLKQKYNINSITPLDMFPGSVHVECVAHLTWKHISDNN